jgi:hypothetical protein
MSNGTLPPSGSGQEPVMPHYEFSGFGGRISGSSVNSAQASLYGMLDEWLTTEMQSLLSELVGITGDMSQVIVIISDLDTLLSMLQNLSNPSFVVPSNYGNEIIAQINTCISAVNGLEGTPNSGVDQVKAQMIADLDDVENLFEVCPFENAFETLSTDMKGLLNVLYEVMNDSTTYFSANKGSIASQFETYYYAVQADVNDLSNLCTQLQDQFGSVPVPITNLNNACQTFMDDLNSISVSGQGLHSAWTSLSSELAGEGPIDDPFSVWLDDLNKACQGVSGYAEESATATYNYGEGVVNTYIPEAEKVTLPANETAELLHEALTVPIGQDPMYEVETQTLIDAYSQATTSTQMAIDVIYQSVSTNLLIAVSTILDTMKVMLEFVKKEGETGMNVIQGTIQQIRKIK